MQQRLISPPHPWHRWWHCRKATVAVEFALLAGVIFAVLLGIVELGRAFWIRNTLQFATEEAARHAMVRHGATDEDLISFAESRLRGLDTNLVLLDVARETVDDTNFVTIRADFELHFLFGVTPGGPFALSGSSRTPLLQ